MLLLLELVDDEVLEGGGEGWGGELAVADFLRDGIMLAVCSSITCMRLSPSSWNSFLKFLLSVEGGGEGLDCLCTLMFPPISFFTGLKATEPNTSNSVIRLSAASRNSVVLILLSLASSTGTSVKLFLIWSKKVDMARCGIGMFWSE